MLENNLANQIRHQALQGIGKTLSSRDSGKALPGEVRRRAERLFNEGFESVRVHISPWPSMLGAAALAVGENVFLDPCLIQGSPRRLGLILGHELAHVVQQRRAGLRGRFGEGRIVGQSALESEADLAGNCFLHGQAVKIGSSFEVLLGEESGIIQCAPTVIHPGAAVDAQIDQIVTGFAPDQRGTGVTRWIWRGDWRSKKLHLDKLKTLAARSIEKFSELFPNSNQPEFIGQLIDLLADLFARARTDNVEAYRRAETIRQSMLLINAHYADQDRPKDLVVALDALAITDQPAHDDLLWADHLSTQQNDTLRDWFNQNHFDDLYLPHQEPALAFIAGHGAVLTAAEQTQFRRRFNYKVRYWDLKKDDLFHADIDMAMCAVAAEDLSHPRVEAMIAPFPLLKLCQLLVHVFCDGPPYRNLRDGGYRISQAILRMAAGQGSVTFGDGAAVAGRFSLDTITRLLRSNYFRETQLRNWIGGLAVLSAPGLETILGRMEAESATDADAALTLFQGQVIAILGSIAGLRATLQTDSIDMTKTAASRHSAATKIAALNGRVHNDSIEALGAWFNNTFIGAGGPGEQSRHVFREFVRVIGFRAVQVPELGASDIKGALACKQVLLNLREMSKPRLNLYLDGLSRIVFVLPTAQKDLGKFSFLESTLETIQQLLDTINRPPITYRRRTTATGRSVMMNPADPDVPATNHLHKQVPPPPTHRLYDIPFVVFDQSDDTKFAANAAYIAQLNTRMKANVHHVSMSQVIRAARQFNASEFFGTKTHQPDAWWLTAPALDSTAANPARVQAGFGGARNITFIMGPAFYRALARGWVADFEAFINRGRDQIKTWIKQALRGHDMIMMGDDDLTLMPGFMHASSILANQAQSGYWKIITRMMGRGTTKVPGAATQFADFPNSRGLNTYRSKVLETMRATAWMYGFVPDGYTWHGFAGVVMQLGSCLDLPLPTEEKLFGGFSDLQNMLGLAIHHPGDRLDEPQARMAGLATYVAQIRIAAKLIGANSPATSDVLRWNTLAGDPTYQTLGNLYAWILLPANRVAIRQAYMRHLLLDYPGDDNMLANNPATAFQALQNRIGPLTFARADFAPLRNELTAVEAGYVKIWKDLNLAVQYRDRLWNYLVARFRAVPVAQQNLAWHACPASAGAGAVARDAVNIGLVEWLIDNGINFDADIDQTKNDLTDITATHPHCLTWADSNLAKDVYLTAVSLGKGRFFNMIQRISV